MFFIRCLLNRHDYSLTALFFISLIFLSSCGGGAAAVAGVGSGGTGVVIQGLVTGFGSVFIDGTEYPLSTTANISETFDGSSTSSGLLSLGQVVTATVDSSSTVVSAEITPDLQGVITYQPTAFTTAVNGTCAASTDYYLYVLNQPVRIVTQACNTSLGVTTVFNEPFSQCTANSSCTLGSPNGFVNSLITGAEVKVHGFWVLNPSTQKPELIATRIDEYYVPTNSTVYYNNPVGVNQPATNYELSGIVTAVSSGTVQINGGNGVNGGNNTTNSYGGSTVSSLIVPSTLANNQVVSMFVPSTNWLSYFPSSYLGTAYSPTTALAVSNLVIQSATSFANGTNPTVQVSGIITSLSGNTAIINGTSVVLPSGCTYCTVGDYVRLKGTNHQGELDGATVEQSLPSNESLASTVVNLNGIIVFPAPVNGVTTIVFQGVTINASNINLTGCIPGATQLVQVKANFNSGSLQASSVTCSTISNTVSANTVADYVGITANFSRNINQFNFLSNNTNYIVTYNSNTYIESDLTSSSSNIEVIGVITSLPSANTLGAITATSLKRTENSVLLKSESD